MPKFVSHVVVLAAVLLLALPVTAGAAVSEYAAHADTSAVSLSVFEEALPDDVGSPLLRLVSTDAMAASDPMADAEVGLINVGGTELAPVREADSTGDADRDPETGDGCLTPSSPVPGITFAFVCSIASADTGPSIPDVAAAATTRLATIGVSGEVLAGILDTSIADVIALAGEEAIQEAMAAFLAECNDLFGETGISDEARALLEMTPDELSILEEAALQALNDLDEDGVCTAVVNLALGDLSDDVLAIDGLLDVLAAAQLITLEIDGAESRVTGTTEGLTATAQQVTVDFGGPTLTSVVDEAITTIVDAIIAEVGCLAAAEPPGCDAPMELPVDFDPSTIFAAIPLFDIDEPLISATIDGGQATSSLAVADASSVPNGRPPSVTITLARGVVDLLDPEASNSVTLAAGQSETIAEGTPLESTISVGALTTEPDDEFEGLPGSSANASATTLALLQGEEAQGGIVLALAASSAGTYGVAPVSSSDDPPLADTGGGAAIAAVVALGAGLALRRRRD